MSINPYKGRINAYLLQKLKVKLLSHVGVFATPSTVTHQAPPSMGVSR